MKQVLLVNGVPASGKSTVTRLLVRGLVAQGVAAVPLIGELQTTSPRRARNNSGDADATCTPWSGRCSTALNGAGLPSASAAPRAGMDASGASAALSRRVRFT